MADEIALCPWCGSRGYTAVSCADLDHENEYQAWCVKCWAHGPARGSASEAIAAWNEIVLTTSKSSNSKVEDLATAKAVVLAAANRLMLPNVTMEEVRNDPIVYAINCLAENARMQDVRLKDLYECAECGSKDVEYDDLSSVENGNIEQQITCNDCGCRRMDIFRLVEQREVARKT